MRSKMNSNTTDNTSRWRTYVKALALLLCAGMILPIAACKKKKKDGNSGDPNSKDRAEYVEESDPYYSDTSTELDVKIEADPSREITSTGIWNTLIADDKIYTAYSLNYKATEEERDFMENCNYFDDEQLLKYYQLQGALVRFGIVQMNMQGEVTGTITMDTHENLEEFQILSDGRIAARLYVFDPETQETKNKIVIMNDQGERQTEIVLRDGDENTWFYTLGEKKYVLVSIYDREIAVINEAGEITNTVKTKYDNRGIYCSGGKFYLLMQDAKYTEDSAEIHNYISEIDPDKETLSEPKEIEGSLPDYLIEQDGKLYYDSVGSFYTYDIATGTSEKICGSEDMDVVLGSVTSMQISENGDIDLVERITTGTGQMSETHLRLTHLHKEEKNPHAGKRLVYMCSCMESSYAVLNIVAAYNKRAESTARVVVYVQTADVGEGFAKAEASAADKVLLDMKSGYGPDLLLNCAEFGQFNNEDILVDLNTYIDGEKGINRADYFDNVFRSFEANGKLYQMPVFYSMIGFNADPKVLGNVDSWNLSEFEQKLDSLGSEIYPTVGHFMDLKYVNTSQGLLYGFLCTDMDHYVDYSKRECYFDSDDFRKTLELSKKYGTRISDERLFELYEEYDVWDNHRQESLLMQAGVCALSTVYCANLESFSEYADLCGNNVLFIGWPTADRSGMTAFADVSIGISAFSDCKDEAWDFISFMISEEGQMIEVENRVQCFYINREAEDADMKLCIEEYNEKLEFYKDDPEMMSIYAPLDDQMAQRLLDVLGKINASISKNPTITNIVLEESEAYFSGSQTAENVSKSIQNRITTLLQETK